MTEPVSTTAAVAVTAAGGIAVLGITTGLQPGLLFAGACGGWWALSYQPPMNALRRLNRVLISAVAGAWGSPAWVGWLSHHGVLTDAVPPGVWESAAALGIGLLAVDVLGRTALRWAENKLQRIRK